MITRSLLLLMMLLGTQLQWARAQSLQPKVDLRPQFDRMGLPPRSQGQRGACQVFAMVGVIEFHLAQSGRPADLSEQFLMWASNQASGQHDRTKGFNPDRLIAGLKRHGICDESLMPYVPRNEKIAKPAMGAVQNAAQRSSCTITSLKHWSSDIGFATKHMQQIQSRLDLGVPVTATLCWPAGLSDKQIVDEHGFIVDRQIDRTSKSGHGVILVGYSVDPAVDGGGYFIIRNSWGRKFAKHGYAKVSFGYAQKYGTDAYIVSVI